MFVGRAETVRRPVAAAASVVAMNVAPIALIGIAVVVVVVVAPVVIWAWCARCSCLTRGDG
jgi:hypothetical protein